MRRNDIKKQIKKQLGCNDDEAERIFERAVEDGIVRYKLNWNFIISLVIYGAVAVTAIWAVWQHIK
jgi:hypothetical protein